MRKHLTAAYGRTYKSRKEVLADFEADKDFVAQPEGRYVNRSQLVQLGYSEANVRYGKNGSKVCVVAVNES